MDEHAKDTVLKGLFNFLVPVLLFIGIFGFIGIFFSPTQRIQYWGYLMLYFFPPMGKESVIPLAICQGGFHPALIAVSIALIDSLVALFLVLNYDLAKAIPLIGNFMNYIETKGTHIVDKHPWIKPIRYIGVILFVMVPFQGSGGMVASILGRLIGMNPWITWSAITIGALIGCSLVSLATIGALILTGNNITLILIVVAIIMIVSLSYTIYSYLQRKRKDNN